jgi:ribosome silencing factor RsfS/YbeB/iojap
LIPSTCRPLFERVIVASGTSNRQTKALAASVRDAVREAGFAKPRVEGEVNGEWIIVDCGQAVVHIMQPNFRQYYNLEELWGEKPVRLKLGSAKPPWPRRVPSQPQAGCQGCAQDRAQFAPFQRCQEGRGGGVSIQSANEEGR